ncbi:MAG: VOC family protein [Pseudomonadota bacterium]
MQTNPYLMLEGRAEEAIDFYVRALGADVEMMMRVSEAPEMPDGACAGGEGMPPMPGDKILHASLRLGASRLMLSDGMCSGRPEFKGVLISLAVESVPEAQRLFDALAEDGQVQMPLGPTFFSPAFGMAADRFGVGWMVVVEGAA